VSEIFVPSDQLQRKIIGSALDETLFIEAGAGTGKTTELVSRVINLIKSGTVIIDCLAVITFTEAAAAELRGRIRRELEENAQYTGNDTIERLRCLDAISNMENTAIQTLHSFAGALLRERPLEAGLPPNFEVLDPMEADINFENRWQLWVDDVLDSESTLMQLPLALYMGLNLDGLKTVARSLHSNYDILPASFPPEPQPARKSVQQVIEASAIIRHLIPLNKLGPDDLLVEHAQRVVALGDHLATIHDQTYDALAFLVRWGKLSFSKGRQSDWETNPVTGENGCKELKAILKELEDIKNNEVELTRRSLLMPILDSVRLFLSDYTIERRQSGKVEFHDLLVWARNLLRDNIDARRHFQHRFTHILIDEFQDTDPIQAEIAFFLSEVPSESDDPSLFNQDWTTIKTVQGKLFVVGDPKQSIYRFRRADIAAVEQVRSLMGGRTIALSQNFRSQNTIIDWVNHIFTKLMGTGSTGIQAPYIELEARWNAPTVKPPMGVHWFGSPVSGPMNRLRRLETSDIAAIISAIIMDQWMVSDDEKPNTRNATYRDVCILIPTRTNLLALERELEAANIPYRIESQSLVLSTQDVREILSCLRAIDSPVDQVALVAALRSSAFGCSDVEILQFLDDGGQLNYVQPGTAKGPVKDALSVLNRYHQERMWKQLDEIIETFMRERRMAEVCYGRLRPRERLRRLRFVVEQARAFAHVGGNSLRSFLDWIERQADENARMMETPVPEVDEDAVRIMTIHGAKGLEFPIVILSGTGSQLSHHADPVIFDHLSNSVEVHIGASNGPAFTTTGYEESKEYQATAETAENIRLLYVSATRAKDHLIVSLFHPEKSGKSHAAEINRCCSDRNDLWQEISDIQPIWDNTTSTGFITADILDTEADRETWLESRNSVLQKASLAAAVAVTTITGTQKEKVEEGESQFGLGRGGTNLGRAVHSVLQIVDLATCENLEKICMAQASAEGITARYKEVMELVQNGINSSVVRQAVASGCYHREVFISMPLDQQYVEGFIDLLFEDEDGYTIVDYKTDTMDDEIDTFKRHPQYVLQAETYAYMLSEVTGKPVGKVVLLFLRSGKEIVVDYIASSQIEFRQRIKSILSTLNTENMADKDSLPHQSNPLA
jgi:ATP-dependent helicase/nuclease subunit A